MNRVPLSRPLAARRRLALVVAALWLVTPATRTAAQEPGDVGRTRAWLDANIPQLMREARLPGFSIAIVRDGTTVYAEGFGARDPKKNLPATADTLYGIGSLTKSFVAIAILQLADRGKLHLDAGSRLEA